MSLGNSNDANINGEILKDEPEHNSDERPQYLCKSCGKCCRVVTTGDTYEELKDLAEKGCEEAIDYLKIFKPYSSIEKASKVLPENVEQILNIMSKSEDFDPDKVTFYYCQYLQDDNKCSIYETRPGCCRRGPHHGWSVFPPDCGFEGWQFEQREKKKKAVRILKEHLHAIESISVDGKVPGGDMTVEEYRKYVEEKIKPLEKYGSMYW